MKTKTENSNKQESFILYNSFYDLYFAELTTEEMFASMKEKSLTVESGGLLSCQTVGDFPRFI